MALGDLKKKLYQNARKKREHGKTIYNPQKGHLQNNALGKESPWQVQERATVLARTWRSPLLKIAITFSVVVLLIFGVWTFVTVRNNLFDAQRVALTIDGPTTVASGARVAYTIKIVNGNSVRLDDVQFVIDHTTAFKIDRNSDFRYDGPNESSLSIGTLKPKEKREIIVNGRFEGIVPGAMYIKPQLSFVPSTTKKRVVRTERLGLMYDRNALQLAINAQKAVPSGTVIEYVVHYQNDSDKAYDNVALTAQFPQGFILHSAEPMADEKDAIWTIGTIAPHTEGDVVIRGTLSGLLDDVKKAVFSLEMRNNAERVILAREEWTTQIAPAALVIEQYVNDQKVYVAHVGEVLRYSLKYKNTSDLGMRDVVVRLHFDDEILDYKHLELSSSGGSLDATTRSVVWRASDVPALALLSPGQEGRITLTIPVRKNITVRDDHDRNITISTTAEIDSPDVPTPIGENKTISSNTTLIKLVSPVRFTVEGFYDDFTLKNSGPIPPLINEKTTFTIRWTLSNATNILANAKVEAFLPTSASWEGLTFPETENIQFNPRTHKIVWNIGEVKNGIGVFRKKREVRFQVGITPTINQVGKPAELLKKSIFTAQDTFTNTPIQVVAQKKTTALSEDPSVGTGVVRQ